MAPSGMELDNGAPIINAYESVAAFEDVFLAQDDLDPHLQALIDDDRDEDRGDNDWMSTLQTPSHTENLSQGWDIDEDMMEFGVGGDLVAYGDVTSSEGSQSGYETDQGETTEEERPVALPSRSTSRSQTPAPSTSTSTTPRNRRPKPGTIITARRSKNGPPVGSFKCDPSKPYALVDGTGKSLVIFNPRKSRGAGSEIFDPWRTKERRLSSGSFRALTAAAGARSLECPQSSPVAQAALIDASPIYRSRTSITSLISSNANPMMSGLVSPATGLSLEAMAGEIVGPPEAFFPFIGVSTIGNPFSDDEDDRINDEDLMDLSEFIDFTGAESETEGDSDPTRLTATGQATPREHAGLSSYGTEISSDTKWLDHLTKRGLINVYRRDQQHKKSLQARRGRAFTMLPPEFNRKKAIKPGRHSIVISPVSPLHRRAPSNPWSSGVKKQSAGAVAVKRRHMPMPTVSQPHRHRRVQTAFY